MATIKVSRCKSIVASIKYLLNEPSHDGKHERVGAVRCLNTTTKTCLADALNLLERTGKMDKAQGYTMIQSFSPEELNPDDPASLELANKIALEVARRSWGEDRQILVVTQADNGKVHSHVVGVSPQITDGKSMRDKELSWKEISKTSDEVLSEMGVINFNADKLKARKTKSTMAEIKRRERGEYVWKDDLRARIDECVNDPKISDFQAFTNALSEKGVQTKITRKGNITYMFTDKEGNEQRARPRVLGDEYRKDEIDGRLQGAEGRSSEKNGEISISFSELQSQLKPARRFKRPKIDRVAERRRRAEEIARKSREESKYIDRECELLARLLQLAYEQRDRIGSDEWFEEFARAHRVSNGYIARVQKIANETKRPNKGFSGNKQRTAPDDERHRKSSNQRGLEL